MGRTVEADCTGINSGLNIQGTKLKAKIELETQKHVHMCFMQCRLLSSHSNKTITCNGRAQNGSTHCGVSGLSKTEMNPPKTALGCPCGEVS